MYFFAQHAQQKTLTPRQLSLPPEILGGLNFSHEHGYRIARVAFFQDDRLVLSLGDLHCNIHMQAVYP